MIVTLKNVKHAAFASQETECFEATIYIDGKKAGFASNEGCGGPTMIHFDDKSMAAKLEAYCLTLPMVKGYDDEGEFHMDPEMLIGDLLAAHLNKKHLQRACKRSTLFRIEGDDTGVYRSLSSPFCERVRDHIVKKYGTKVIEILDQKADPVSL